MISFKEDSSLRNKKAIFKDRFDAGRKLAEFMADEFEEQSGAIVLAIPAGGVPVGIELSRTLRLDFDCLIVRKIQIPGNTEAGFGAIASGGEALLNHDLIHRLELTKDQIDTQTQKVQQELVQRERIFRNNRPLPDLTGRTAVLTDDGLASGFTMLAAIKTIRQRGAQNVVVSVPTAPLDTVHRLKEEVDMLYSLHVQEAGPFAVANAYRNWYDLSREEVVELLRSNSARAE